MLPDFPINEQYWKNMTDAQLSEFVDEIFNHYRTKGFPHYELSWEKKLYEFEKIQNQNDKSLIVDDIVRQTMHGLTLAWTYFPHAWSVQCNDLRTPVDVFNDDVLFKKAIIKRLKYGTYISDSGIRKTLKTYTGTQAVSNFRPTAALAIYNAYCPEGGTVWDMSCGYGGRLLGALASKNVGTYIGTDPATETFAGLEQITKDFLPLTNKKVQLHQIGSEDFEPEPESLDFCFTSPPYFNCEKYSKEETQSYVKFPERDAWLHGFLIKTLNSCVVGLKPNRYILLNIAGVKSWPTLTDDILANLPSTLVHEKTMKLELSRMMGTNKKENKFKYEPIFVFKKT